MTPKQRPLGGCPARFRLRYAKAFLEEVAQRDDWETLLEELRSNLAVDPLDPPGRRTKALQGEKPLRRYRPHIDNAVRILYALKGQEVWVLALHPRSTAYRQANLRTAHKRLDEAAAPS